VGAAVETAAAAARALGVAAGPTTTQILLRDDEPLVAKVSARVGGGHDGELCRVALGVDLNALAVAAALGTPLQPHELMASAGVGGACVRFLIAPPGQLQAVHGLEEAYELDGVRGIRVYRKPGHVFRELGRASDRAGAILATGGTRAAALDVANRAASLIRFVCGRAEAVA
jgi:biotin carboxylase